MGFPHDKADERKQSVIWARLNNDPAYKLPNVIKYTVPGGNMATLRKTEFFHLETAGKVRAYHGCCLDRSFVCINNH
jgi:hypothetical protein